MILGGVGSVCVCQLVCMCICMLNTHAEGSLWQCVHARGCVCQVVWVCVCVLALWVFVHVLCRGMFV